MFANVSRWVAEILRAPFQQVVDFIHAVAIFRRRGRAQGWLKMVAVAPCVRMVMVRIVL
jgi:hypothetical protein